MYLITEMPVYRHLLFLCVPPSSVLSKDCASERWSESHVIMTIHAQASPLQTQEQLHTDQ